MKETADLTSLVKNSKTLLQEVIQMLDLQMGLVQQEKMRWREEQLDAKGARRFDFQKSQDENLLI